HTRVTRTIIPSSFLLTLRLLPRPTLFPYTTLFRSLARLLLVGVGGCRDGDDHVGEFRLVRKNLRSCERGRGGDRGAGVLDVGERSEEHTSELQSLRHLVCRLLLEKKK